MSREATKGEVKAGDKSRSPRSPRSASYARAASQRAWGGRTWDRAGVRVGMVSFYWGRRIKQGEELPAPGNWEMLPGAKFLMAQAIAFPVQLVEDHNAYMLEFTRSNERPYATDPGTAAWLKARGLRYLRAWPAIVQHDEVKSLYGHNMNPNRYSESYRRTYG